MTDQIPADKVREVRDLHRDAAKMVTITDAEREIHQHVADAMDALLAAPPLPTLADMTDDERSACQWMQADTKPWGRVVIIVPDLSDGRAALLDIWGDVAYEDHDTITPRPDLPRLEWPGDTEAAPAPALPGQWRLANHEDHGRVLVVRIFRDKAIYATPAEALGIHTHVALVSDLTFADTDNQAMEEA